MRLAMGPRQIVAANVQVCKRLCMFAGRCYDAVMGDSFCYRAHLLFLVARSHGCLEELAYYLAITGRNKNPQGQKVVRRRRLLDMLRRLKLTDP